MVEKWRGQGLFVLFDEMRWFGAWLIACEARNAGVGG
jgi:hypothetical protein